MYKDQVVVVHGTASLGHPYQEFLRGEFARRAICAYSSETGKFLWGGRKNYRKRPIIVGDYVYAAPEGRSGCTCATPIKHVSINLGAPGFREDDQKTLWIPYPARGGGGILGNWLPTYQDVVREASGPRKALVKEFKGIEVRGSLVVGLQSSGDSEIKVPILCGIQAVRE